MSAALRSAKAFLTSEQRSSVVRGVTTRVAKGVHRRRARWAATVRPAVRPASDKPTAPVAPFRTFYDAAPTRAFVDAWSKTHVEQAASPYFKTHAGRFALMAEIIRRLDIDGACLDVGGTSMTKEIFLDQTSLSSFDLTPKVDLETEVWADLVGLDKYDLVIFLEVIEHLQADPSRALHEINRCMAHNGLLILTTVNIGSELGLYNLARGEAPYVMANIFGKRQDRHQREYAPEELQRLVAAHGFETWATTINVYPDVALKRRAHEWVQKNLSAPREHLHGDTIVIVGRKVETSKRPRWIHPIYHDSISENRRDTVPEDVAALVKDGFPPALEDFFHTHSAP